MTGDTFVTFSHFRRPVSSSLSRRRSGASTEMGATVLTVILRKRPGQRANIRLQENFREGRAGLEARDMAADKALECADAANKINRAIMDAVNSGADRPVAESAALKVKYADLGAMDSEPLWRLGELLERLYDRRGALRQSITTHAEIDQSRLMLTGLTL